MKNSHSPLFTLAAVCCAWIGSSFQPAIRQVSPYRPTTNQLTIYQPIIHQPIICQPIIHQPVLGAWDPISPEDTLFIRAAAIGNITEISAGQLAFAQGAGDSVKNFGRRMIGDHTACLNELKTIADSLHVPLPPTPDEEHMAVLQSLASMKGQAFDKAYIASQENGHQKAIALFTREATTSGNMRLQAFAQKYLPILQMHLQMLPK